MTDPIEAAHGAFKEEITRTVLPFMARKAVDPEGLARLEEGAARLARLLKGREFVSKSLLNAIWTTQKILENEAPYCGGHRDRVLQCSSRLAYYHDLILLDEAPEDRVSGVPRIF